MNYIDAFASRFLKAAGMTFGMSVLVVMVAGWCVLVFILTGRLPWLVRKYF